MRFFRLLFILIWARLKGAVRYTRLDAKRSKTPLYTVWMGAESTQNMKWGLLLACWYHIHTSKFNRHCKQNGSDAICSNWLLFVATIAEYVKKGHWNLSLWKTCVHTGICKANLNTMHMIVFEYFYCTCNHVDTVMFWSCQILQSIQTLPRRLLGEVSPKSLCPEPIKGVIRLLTCAHTTNQTFVLCCVPRSEH